MPTNNAIDLNAQGMAYYNGTGTFSGVDASTAAFVLTSNGTGVAPSFQAASGGSNSISGFFANGTSGSSPADATTYYMINGTAFGLTTDSAETRCRIYIPYTTTINNVYGLIRVNGTLGSAQDITLFIRKNNTSNTNITTTARASSADNSFNGTSLGLSLAAGDFITFGFTGPTWTTNPTNVFVSLGFSS